MAPALAHGDIFRRQSLPQLVQYSSIHARIWHQALVGEFFPSSTPLRICSLLFYSLARSVTLSKETAAPARSGPLPFLASRVDESSSG